MITIKAGLTNSVVLRLNDNVTIQNPIFLFELTSVQSKEKFLFTAQDYSTNSRYNQFYIREISGITASLAPTASTPQILLEYGGFYNYKVIQKSDYDLSYGDEDVVLDTGKGLFVNGEYLNFFFELNEDYVFEGYVLEGYVFGGSRDYIFDEWSESKTFEFEDGEDLEVFDPEFNDEALMTEDDYFLIGEDEIQILY